MAIEAKGNFVILAYVKDGVPYIVEIDAAGKLAVRAAEIETLLAAGLPAALDSGALKVREQAPLGLATNKLFGYNDTYSESIHVADAVAGDNDLIGTIVPAGEIWIIHSIIFQNHSTASGLAQARLWKSGVFHVVKELAGVTTPTWYTWEGQQVLKAGDSAAVYMGGVTLHDVLNACFSGYKMKVA